MTSRKSADEPLSVTVRIMGKEYSVMCPPEEHEALVKSADYLNERMTSIRRRGKALGTEKIAIMAALNIARELLELKGVEGVANASPEAVQRLRQLSLDIDSTLSLE
ncbi:cell division protein ZapA [Fontimonas thermophila]|uniref:Cell division protein ZapA n=1 Tax=Fontimonas thermophila TaxID=1076937 RepID=A0A1I2J0V0_9GAMM|nr:cell division protein ZapA [Fontimonas thermophila]SFF48352.1 cell division protein ZapA [Fontimonas thermophila]